MAPFLEFRSGLRVGGHPLHALLVHFPMALWLLVFPLEMLGWALEWETGWMLAFRANTLAVLFAVPTVLAGAWDLAAIRDARAAAVGGRHMIVMLCAAAAFGGELALRGGARPPAGGGAFLTLALSLAGTVLLLAGGWLGGELVFRHGVGRKDKDA